MSSIPTSESAGRGIYVIGPSATAAGHQERMEALAADGLVALATAKAGAPVAAVQIVVDQTAFERGHVDRGERCEIPGIGSIPVATTRALAINGSVTSWRSTMWCPSARRAQPNWRTSLDSVDGTTTSRPTAATG